MKGETTTWGGVHFSAKKVLKSSENVKKRSSVPHFWDDIKESNEVKYENTTFTGIK